MDSRPVPPEYLVAGANYLDALRKLDLNPNFLGWGWENASARWLLVMVTSIIDAGGPLALNKLLFEAYNAEATPKEISPFNVRVFSVDIVPDDLYMLGQRDLLINQKNGEPIENIKISNVQKTFMGIDLEMINSYQIRRNTKLKYHVRRESWLKFKSNVERLAA